MYLKEIRFSIMHKECSGVVFRLDSPCENKGFLFVRFEPFTHKLPIKIKIQFGKIKQKLGFCKEEPILYICENPFQYFLIKYLWQNQSLVNLQKH